MVPAMEIIPVQAVVLVPGEQYWLSANPMKHMCQALRFLTLIMAS
ncbi:Uncharacterised protein [Serratia marcescens]|nr:Uncharacterised protein [Serratia marcescens]CVE69237.1 Uncharacterised protein [Serratia marcescens]CVH26900.1 Uncharacterised protein [Serratia marcescens]